MKKFLNNRVLPIVCVFSILISLCVVPVSASFDDGFRDYGSVSDWEALIRGPGDAFLELSGIAFGILSPNPSNVFWSFVDSAVMPDIGEVGPERLSQLCSKYESAFDRPIGDSFFSQIVEGSKEVFSNTLAYMFLGTMNLNFVVEQHPSSGLMRIKETSTGLWVVSSSGAYPYCESGSNCSISGGNHWISKSSAESNLSKSQVLTGSQMKQTLTTLQLAGEPVYVGNFASKYKAIYRDGREVYANPDGYPFVSAANDAEWAVNQSRPDTSVKDENGNPAVDENGNIIDETNEGNTTNIDLSGMTVTLPDGFINFIDKLIYDESTKSYHIDSHDTYNYTTYNYYQWNYYINYTSITYIGQTEEYNKYYEVYYELPDGRDSADLTREELEQLNLGIDVMPYERCSDDTSLRSLYHFDGDVRDSSYWNYCTDFTWNTGASLTYMDAGVFDGALYLDETEHQFTLTLPSNIGTSDFSIMFRLYQSATAAPQTDSGIFMNSSSGLNTVFQTDGRNFKDSSGSMLCSTPIGTWNEICISRCNGVLRYYVNGVYYSSLSDSNVYSNTIIFKFGSNQQTFKYLDELRVYNFATESSYTPTAVPVDTNLALVLPGESIPVADEYWDFTVDNSVSPVYRYDFSNTELPSDLVLVAADDADNYVNNLKQEASAYYGNEGKLCLSSKASYTLSDGVFSLYSPAGWRTSYRSSRGYAYYWSGGLFIPLGYYHDRDTGGLDAGDYKFSVVLDDGTTYTFDFSYSPSYGATSNTCLKGSFDIPNGQLVWYQGRDANNFSDSYIFNDWVAVISNDSNTPVPIRYIELIPASGTPVSAELITSVVSIDKSQLNTPTLAVKTDIAITSTQIGGVRPSIPTKGQVWALVEGGFIRSLQIYNGQAWEGVDGRIWTGERWIPTSSYNIITLQDMYDIVDSTPNYEYIYSEAGFWSWWQKSWNTFVERLFIALGAGGVGTSGSSGGVGSSELDNVDLDAADEVSDPDEEDGKTFWQFIVLVIAGGKSVVSGVRHMFSGVVSSVPGSMESVTNAFDSGGVAVGFMDGTTSDPDAVDMPAVLNEDNEESEVLDPWRYR